MKRGIAASKGYSIGKVFLKEDKKIKIERRTIDNIKEEIIRFETALDVSKRQIEKIKEKAEKELGADKASVFDSHIMLLDDPEFSGLVENKIKSDSINAEKALSDIVEMYMATFTAMEDEYLKERGADVKDVGKRILANLMGNLSRLSNMGENTIIVAHDLTPSDTAQLDKSKVIAFLTDIGGKTSHSAIMSRTLEIPAVVGMKDITSSVKNGDTAIVDGVEGIAIINPDEKTIREYELKKKDYEMEKVKLRKLINVEAKTKDGKRVLIAGNIGKPQDVDQVIKNGADAIGLFRTEFLYMDRDEMPGEEQQFEAYKYVLEKMENKPVVIRTLDIGGDKKLSYLPLAKEMNPFLGYRAIRLCLDRQDIFKIQLRALLRASVYGNLKIMFPMISSLEEIFQTKNVIKKCKEELKKEGKQYKDDIEVGIMVEIPAAAINSEELINYVDFFSIGTNDLIQYTLAVDRTNEKVSYLYNPMHPAVLKLIKLTIESAHKAGKWCGMCGEMAGDERAIPTLVEYELDEFSMSASSILKAKQLIMEK